MSKQYEEVCPECNGWGVIPVDDEEIDPMDFSPVPEEDICPVCNGEGIAY